MILEKNKENDHSFAGNCVADQLATKRKERCERLDIKLLAQNLLMQEQKVAKIIQ